MQVAMMTGYTDAHNISQALEDGAVSVLHKPINFDKFIATVNDSKH